MELPNDYQEIVKGLIELRKQGRFHAVYVDAGEVRIQRNMWDVDKEYLSWNEARALAYRKMIGSEVIDDSKRTKNIA